MADSLLQVKDLVTQFKGKKGVVTAVDGVSFSVEKGETLCIVGESGCGKSVTALSILRLIPQSIGWVQSGAILFQGDDLLQKSSAEMRKVRGNDIAMIFQDSMTGLNPVLTIGRQLAETILAHRKLSRKEAWAKSVEMLEKVGIPSPEQRMREYPFQLSGGMRQRVMIAMALSCSARLLIADEPTTALDVTIQAQILELMRKIKEQDKTSIIMITHDMGVVAEMADKVMVMYAGKEVECGAVKELFTAPLHPYTQGLLASIPKLNQNDGEDLHTIEGTVPDLNHMPSGCRFCARCAQASPRCEKEEPGLFQMGGQAVRCWLYEN